MGGRSLRKREIGVRLPGAPLECDRCVLDKCMDHNDVYARWEKTGLLEGVRDQHGLAACLEVQRVFNETHEMPPQFLRLTIPIIRRLFGESKAVQRNHFTSYFEEAAWPQLMTFRTKYNPPKPSAGNYDVLQAEADYCGILTRKLAAEIDEAFRDKRDMEVIYRGLGLLDDGTVVMYYS